MTFQEHAKLTLAQLSKQRPITRDEMKAQIERVKNQSSSKRKKSPPFKKNINDSNLWFMDGGWVTPDRDFESSEKRSKFIKKIINKNTNHDISRESKKSNGAVIEAVASYLRRSESTIQEIKNSKLYRKRETERLKAYITNNNLLVYATELGNHFEGGAEQEVYLSDDGKNVFKTNSCAFYNTWEDYLHNLLLHNYFFPDTTYELVGFMEGENNKLFAVVKQPFIQDTKETDLKVAKQFMFDNGFVNTHHNDYRHPKLGVILEDLHTRNVLTKDGFLCFIDTVFYISSNK